MPPHLLFKFTALGALLLWAPLPASSMETTQLFSQSLESLLDLEIETASRTSEPLSQTPAAAQVITQDDIERSGARVIPEVLRLVPGIEAFQITPALWSVSSRGFSGRYSNKLLVLIDGRSIYNSIYNGVYWEAYAIPLSDVKKIEVVRGTGTALWGSNAVNGVINIITKHSNETQGLHTKLITGTQSFQGDLSWGNTLSDDAQYRIHLKQDNADSFDSKTSPPIDTSHQRSVVNTRIDWNLSSRDELTLQNDWSRINYSNAGLFYQVIGDSVDEAFNQSESHTESNSTAIHWQRSSSAHEQLQLRLSHQYLSVEGASYNENNRISQLDFQHSLALSQRHSLTWGLGGKYTDVKIFSSAESLQLAKNNVHLSTHHAFLQDNIQLLPDTLNLIIGAKVEHNKFTGEEWLPQVRMIWHPQSQTSLWTSVSKTHRTPSIAEQYMRMRAGDWRATHDENPLNVPLTAYLKGNPEYRSEELTAYELGWRSQITPKLAADLVLYVNEYENLRDGLVDTIQFGPDSASADLLFTNGVYGKTRGIELLIDWHISQHWSSRLSYNHIDFDMKSEHPILLGVFDTSQQYEHFSPKQQAGLTVNWAPRQNFQINLWLRHVEGFSQQILDVHAPKIETYQEASLRLQWRFSNDTVVELLGHNLLNAQHAEYTPENWFFPLEIPRSIHFSLQHNF